MQNYILFRTFKDFQSGKDFVYYLGMPKYKNICPYTSERNEAKFYTTEKALLSNIRFIMDFFERGGENVEIKILSI